MEAGDGSAARARTLTHAPRDLSLAQGEVMKQRGNSFHSSFPLSFDGERPGVRALVPLSFKGDGLGVRASVPLSCKGDELGVRLLAPLSFEGEGLGVRALVPLSFQ